MCIRGNSRQREATMPSANSQDPKIAAPYARVSTDKQAKTGHSLSQQIEALQGYTVREATRCLKR